MTPVLLALLCCLGRPAAAGGLLEATDGVLGRGEVEGGGGAEQRARTLSERGRWAEAALAWSEARTDGADELSARQWEVVSLARAERWDEARLVALATLAREPADPKRRLLYAWLMCAGGAERAARKVARRVPGEGGEELGAAVLSLRTWRHQDRRRGVRRARRQALQRVQADAWLWLESSQGHFAAFEPEALDDLDRAVRAPGATGAHVAAWMELRLALGDEAEALRAGLSGMARFPEHSGVAAMTAVTAGRPEGGAALERVLGAEPQDPVALEVRGALRLATDDPAGALQDLLAAARGGRDSAAVVGMIGRALVSLGKPGEAHAALRGGMERHPHSLGLAELRFEVARDLADPGQLAAAAEAWRLAAARTGDPLPTAVLRARAEALHRLGRAPEALAAWEEALRAAPDDADLAVAFAIFLLEPGGGLPPDPARARTLALGVQRPGGAALPADDAGLAEHLRRFIEASP